MTHVAYAAVVLSVVAAASALRVAAGAAAVLSLVVAAARVGVAAPMAPEAPRAAVAGAAAPPVIASGSALGSQELHCD